MKKWNDEELLSLIEDYKNISDKNILAKKYNVSIGAIYHKINHLKKKGFDIKSFEERKWSNKEIEYLKSSWTNKTQDEILNNLNRNWISILQKAKKLKLPKRNIRGKSQFLYKCNSTKEIFSASKDKQGYILININGMWIRSHRYEAENFFNVKLSKNEIVHHKDGNKENNSKDNLEITTRNKHAHLDTKRATNMEKYLKENNLYDDYITWRNKNED